MSARYVVAVSGGVDSVALLDMLTKVPGHELIVAHVDHGIRPDSADDARFVADLATRYGLPFRLTRVELGEGASEEAARAARYAFLRQIANDHDARIVTAHHANDVIETIAINLHRGTGWRGVATHGADIARPLLAVSKAQLHDYARRHNLRWREDSTNQSQRYLRNRIRQHVATLPDDHKRRLLELRTSQLMYKKMIDEEVTRLVGDGPTYSRYFFSHIPEKVAIECLRYVTRGQLTRPQMQRLLLAIKTTRPTKTYQAGNSIQADFTSRNFTITLVK